MRGADGQAERSVKPANSLTAQVLSAAALRRRTQRGCLRVLALVRGTMGGFGDSGKGIGKRSPKCFAGCERDMAENPNQTRARQAHADAHERGKKSVHRRPPPLTSSHQRGEWAYAVSAPLPVPWPLRPAGLRGALPPTPEATTLAWITKTKARQASPT